NKGKPAPSQPGKDHGGIVRIGEESVVIFEKPAAGLEARVGDTPVAAAAHFAVDQPACCPCLCRLRSAGPPFPEVGLRTDDSRFPVLLLVSLVSKLPFRNA